MVMGVYSLAGAAYVAGKEQAQGKGGWQGGWVRAHAYVPETRVSPFAPGAHT